MTALVLVDLQREFTEPNFGCIFGDVDRSDVHAAPYFDRVATSVVPTATSLLQAARAEGREVIHVVVESLVDGRDMGSDYRECGIIVARGSPGAAPCDARLAPQPNEIVLRKATSSVFNSTSAERLFRNLGIEHLVVAGVMSDCCVASTVRDAADLGFWVTVVEEGCAALDHGAHAAAMSALAGYGNVRVVPAATALAELRVGGAPSAAPTAAAAAAPTLKLNLAVLAASLAVVRLPPSSRIPAWAHRALDCAAGGLVAIARTPAELSIVAPETLLDGARTARPAGQQAERGWRALRVEGPLDFALVGILAALATTLADAGVSIFAISTYDTDYILVKAAVLGAACASLASAGHSIAHLPPAAVPSRL